MIIILCGVTGSGKTTLGETLSQKLNWPFFEGDKFHTRENIQKMSQGTALNDEDREPWLAAISEKMKVLHLKEENAVFACSALKQSYRNKLKKSGAIIHFIFLTGEKEEIRLRFAKRKDHFMPESLIESQFEILEEPGENEALRLQSGAPLEEQLQNILLYLNLGD